MHSLKTKPFLSNKVRMMLFVCQMIKWLASWFIFGIRLCLQTAITAVTAIIQTLSKSKYFEWIDVCTSILSNEPIEMVTKIHLKSSHWPFESVHSMDYAQMSVEIHFYCNGHTAYFWLRETPSDTFSKA